MHTNPFLLDLALVLGVAAVTALIARLLKQPTILGYLVAGLIVGPYLPIPIFVDAERVHTVAEFGVILVMFAIGLEFRIARLVRVLPTAGLTGLVQIAALFWAGYAVGRLVGWSGVESLFLGAGIAISSTMVVSKVFEQVRPPEDVRELVLGVLVVQDIIAIVLVAAMTGVAHGGGLSGAELAKTLGGLGGLLVAFVVGGMLIVPRVFRFVVKLDQPEILVVLSAGLCFGMALIAAELGYSVALGAFIAGVLVAESGEGVEVEHKIQPLRDFFAAVFFVSIGMTVDPSVAIDNLPVALVVGLVVIVMQLVSVTIAGVLSGNGLRRAVKAGVALGQVGEFGFILAGIATAAGVAGPELQSVLVLVAILTAFTTPLLLRRAQAIVHLIDHVLPKRVQHLLSLYEAWLERLRTRPDGRRAPMVRAIRLIALDAVGAIVIVALAIGWLPKLTGWLAGVGLDRPLATGLVVVTALVLAAPLFVGVVRNARSLSRLVAASVLPEGRPPDSAERVAAQVLAVMIRVAVTAGVGFPTLAVLQPVTGELWGAILLAVVFLVVGVYLWKSAGALADEVESGAQYMATMLARQAAAPQAAGVPATLAPVAATPAAPATPPPETHVVPGLEGVTIVVPPRSRAVGRTLSQLDLRAVTGADVLAIHHRDKGNVVLPTGHERIQAGDLIAVTGPVESLALARETFDTPPEGEGAT